MRGLPDFVKSRPARKKYGRPYICEECGAEVYWRRTDSGGESASKQALASRLRFGKELCARCQHAEYNRRLDLLRPYGEPIFRDAEHTLWFVAPAYWQTLGVDAHGIYTYREGDKQPFMRSECETLEDALASLRQRAEREGWTREATRKKPDLIEAIRTRRERALVVEETYTIEYVGMQSWVVQHPDEPERAYFVDMIDRACSCPDSWCFRVDGEQVDCKHIGAVQPLWEALTGVRLPFVHHGRATADCGFVAVRDADRDEDGNPCDPFAID